MNDTRALLRSSLIGRYTNWHIHIHKQNQEKKLNLINNVIVRMYTSKYQWQNLLTNKLLQFTIFWLIILARLTNSSLDTWSWNQSKTCNILQCPHNCQVASNKVQCTLFSSVYTVQWCVYDTCEKVVVIYFRVRISSLSVFFAAWLSLYCIYLSM